MIVGVVHSACTVNLPITLQYNFHLDDFSTTQFHMIPSIQIMTKLQFFLA